MEGTDEFAEYSVADLYDDLESVRTEAGERSTPGEEIPVIGLMSSPARVAMIGAFLLHQNREFNKSEIAEEASLARSTVHEHLPVLRTMGIVTEANTGSGRTRYTLDQTTAVTKALQILEGVALKRLLSISEDVDAYDEEDLIDPDEITIGK